MRLSPKFTVALRLVLDRASNDLFRRSILTIAPYRAFENVFRPWRQTASEGRSRTVEWRAILNAGEMCQKFSHGHNQISDSEAGMWTAGVAPVPDC